MQLIHLRRGADALGKYESVCRAFGEQANPRWGGAIKYDPIHDAFTRKYGTQFERITPTCWAVYELA